MSSDNNVLNLSSTDVVRVLSALTAVMPSGGGSPTYSLIQKITQQTGCEYDEELLFKMCNIVIDDAVEYGVVERLLIA